MRSHSLVAVSGLLLFTVSLFAGIRPADEPKGDEKKAVPVSNPQERVFTGLNRDGFVQLPN